jgi:hypothetical protein
VHEPRIFAAAMEDEACSSRSFCSIYTSKCVNRNSISPAHEESMENKAKAMMKSWKIDEKVKM